MNHTMGRFIDEATDEVRDRLVTAEEFNDGQAWWGPNGCGCLVGTAGLTTEEGRRHDIALAKHSSPAMLPWGFGHVPWKGAPASIRYPKAVARFGKDRVVRAIKLRAGASLDDLPATETRETVEVG